MKAPHHPLVTEGYHDAVKGITANPYSLHENRRLWAEGHDLAYDNGEAPYPRFGRFGKKRRTGACALNLQPRRTQ